MRRLVNAYASPVQILVESLVKGIVNLRIAEGLPIHLLERHNREEVRPPTQRV